MALDKINRQPIRQRENGWLGQNQSPLRPRHGLRIAPGLRCLELRRVLRIELEIGIRIVWTARHIVQHFFAGDTVHHHALILAQRGLRILLRAGRRYRVIPRQVLGQVARVARVLVVVIQLVGHAAEPAQTLQP